VLAGEIGKKTARSRFGRSAWTLPWRSTVSDSSRTVPGTGLSPRSYSLLVALSVALFLFWDGPLWTAKREASHVARFVVSYLAVIPAAVLLLALARRLSWSHGIAATGSAWGIKLVITSVLYFTLARGTALVPTVPQTAATPSSPPIFTPEYQAGKADFERGAIRGSVVRGPLAVAGAVVWLDKPAPGLPLGPTPPPRRLTLDGLHYDQAMILARSDESFDLVSKDAVLHTLHLYDGGRAVLNVPVPPGAASRPFTWPDTGIYEARCDSHATEKATVVVVDHPYATQTDQLGQFVLSDVAVGPVTVTVVVRASGDETAGLVRRTKARVEAGQTTVVQIDLSTPEVAEQRL